jgi:hypothetical protein
MQEFDDPLPHDQAAIATRCANEGVPVAAIGRILCAPFARVHEALSEAMMTGDISTMPKSDWPPAVKWGDRVPACPRSTNPDDMEMLCGRVFNMTRLEAGFLVALMRMEFCDKDKLHAVVEKQRATRQQRPDKMDATDPKIVDVMICKLRKKLRGVNPTFKIGTSWGRGYYIEGDIKAAIQKTLDDYRT